MRKFCLPLLVLISLQVFGQKRELSYRISNAPVFLNQLGDTFHKALLGGLNQPQFQKIDINNDGLKDLLIHDRSGPILLPFINKGDDPIEKYQYEPKYVSAFPKMGNTWFLFVDYDKDGKEDLWVNLNFKTLLFRNITEASDPVIKFFQVSDYLKAYNFNPPPFPDSNSVSCGNFNVPTIADVDGDGDIDIFSYQANEGNLLLYRNMTVDFNLPLHPPVFDLADFCWGNFRDTALDGVKLASCPYKIYRKHGGGSTLLWFDNDNDGDLDLLMGNAGGDNLIFLKNGKKEFNLDQDSMISYIGHWPQNSDPVKIGSFPAAFMLDVDGDKVQDILVAPNQYERVYPIEEKQQVWFYKNYGSNSFPDFKLEKKNFFTDQIVDHGSYTAPILYDIDGDGDLDLILASNGSHAITDDKNDRLILYRNIGDKKQAVFKLEDEDLWGLSNDSLSLLSLAIGDINGDGKPDLITGNYYGNLYYYKNIGTSTTWAFTTPIKDYKGINVGESSSPQLVDLDKDGLLDLVIGEKEGNFNYYRNTGTKTDPEFALVDDTLGNFITNEFSYYLNPPGYYYTGNAAGEIVDLDGDNNYDMIFGGEEGRIRVMKFDRFDQQNFVEDTLVLFDSAYMSYKTMDFGTRTRPAVGDLDGDGIPDVLIGNDRGGLHFIKGEVSVTSVAQIRKRNQPLIYPNPNNGDILKVDKRSPAECNFKIYDLSGKLVLKDKSAAGKLIHEISVEALSSGVYFLHSSDGKEFSYYNKFVIQK
ncbi:MAG: T9SS type A sorting domain-containing protein [Flavobacteriales bacterium]|nr:T9SS type A sorting domain-containing protein [Flavobacteriales bacterium]